jgi:hypothetical protein
VTTDGDGFTRFESWGGFAKDRHGFAKRGRTVVKALIVLGDGRAARLARG